MTDDEVRLLDLVFAGTIDRRQITLTDTAGKGGRAFALGLTSAAAMTDPVFAYAIANIKAGRV